MANRARGEVGFEVDGVAYTLVYSVNAICQMEDALSVSMAKLGADMAAGSTSAARSAFWACLLEHHPDLTPQDAGRLMTVLGPAKAGDLLGQAMSAALPEPAAGPLGRSRPPAAKKR